MAKVRQRVDAESERSRAELEQRAAAPLPSEPSAWAAGHTLTRPLGSPARWLDTIARVAIASTGEDLAFVLNCDETPWFELPRRRRANAEPESSKEEDTEGAGRWNADMQQSVAAAALEATDPNSATSLRAAARAFVAAAAYADPRLAATLRRRPPVAVGEETKTARVDAAGRPRAERS